MHGEWDAARLTQVVSNLIGNAIQHGEADCTVECAVDGTEADHVVLSVRNRGRIPDDVLPHVFDPFRSRESHHSREDGLGLGLYIVDQIARAHEGSAEVRCDDIGTTFRVTIPRHAPAACPL